MISFFPQSYQYDNVHNLSACLNSNDLSLNNTIQNFNDPEEAASSKTLRIKKKMLETNILNFSPMFLTGLVKTFIVFNCIIFEIFICRCCRCGKVLDLSLNFQADSKDRSNGIFSYFRCENISIVLSLVL